MTPKPHKQYYVKPKPFDAYPQDDPIKRALGSVRSKGIQEIDLKSTNYDGNTIPTIPYRLTKRGIDIQDLSSFIAGSIIPSEILGGSGTSFTFANPPIAILSVAGNGVVLTSGVDYSVSGSTLTVLVGSYSAGTIVASYLK